MKVEHKYKSPKRLMSMIINNICNDEIDQFKTNLSIYKSLTNVNINFQKDMLYQALTKCSKNCSEYLLDTYPPKIIELSFVFRSCKWDKSHENFIFLNEISKKYQDLKFNLSKKDVIKRLLEVSKVETNPKRVDYTFELAKKGFIDLKEIREVINENYVQETKKAAVVAILRELNLRELGIE